MAAPYPQVLPLTEVSLVINTIKNRAIESNKKPFFKALWTIMGYGLLNIVGEPEEDHDTSGQFGAVTPASAADCHQMAVLLQGVIDAQTADGEFGATALAEFGKIGDGTILKLLMEYGPQIIALIQLLFPKK